MATTEDNREIEQLKGELETLRKDFRQLTDTFKSMSRQQLNAGADYARQSADQVRGQAREATQSLEHEISQRPFSSVAAAFGIGFIMGKLLDR